MQDNMQIKTRIKSDGIPDYVGRYAPSPTGDLHFGNVIAAFCAFSRAVQANGKCVLRIEDLDTPRVIAGAAQRIEEDLASLGILFDAGPQHDDGFGPYKQSNCLSRYDAVLQELAARDLVYACTCSRRDIERAASAPHVGEEGPIYPQTCRHKNIPLDAPHASIRLKIPTDESSVVFFTDMICGLQRQDLRIDVGDFILRRKDGIFAYQLAVVADDHAQGITEVVRGRDLLTSTARQILLYKYLGWSVPSFAHVPLCLDEHGEKLSKRRGDETLRALLKQHGAHAVLSAVAETLGIPRVVCQKIIYDAGEGNLAGAARELAQRLHPVQLQPPAVSASRIVPFVQ